MSDARFSALYDSHHYNIDPSESSYKKTDGMNKIIQEKIKRRAGNATLNNHNIHVSSGSQTVQTLYYFAFFALIFG